MFRPQTTTIGLFALTFLPVAALAEPKAGFTKDTAGPVAQEISVVSPNADWAGGVRAILLRHFDADASGGIGPREIAAMPCDVWAAVDAGSKAQSREAAAVVYGFDPAFVWAGGALGFDLASRAQAAAQFGACAAPPAPKEDGADLLQMLQGNGAPVAASGSPGLASRIRAIAPKGGSSEWDGEAKSILVKEFDKDGSGDLGSSEIAGITCDVWSALDTEVRESWDGGLYVTYGFAPGGIWVGYAIGISESAKAPSGRNLKSCVETGALPTTQSGGAAGRIAGISASGGGSEWDAAARDILLEDFDQDGSGWIDNKDEVAAIDCDTWAALDGRIREQWTSMYVTYGFDLSLSWIAGSTLNISANVRGQASGAVLNCGLSEDRSPAAQISMLPDGGSSGWDAEAAAILRANFDADGDGLVEPGRKEFDQIPCSVWIALDGGVRYNWSSGLAVTYGFQQGVYLHQALGLHKNTRKKGAKMLEECGIL